MASFHSRSHSLPSKSHPAVDNVENLICRMKSSQAASTSSLCSNLASLRDLHDGINSLIQLPSVQQSLSLEQGEKWMNELLETSLGLVDLSGFSRDLIYSTKESIQELESSIRRNRGETATNEEIKAYVASRKKITKKVNKYIKNLKSFNRSSSCLPDKEDYDLKAIATVLKEAQALDFAILQSVLLLLFEENGRPKQCNWSLLSRFTHSTRVHSQEAGPEVLCFLNIPKSTKSIDNVNILKQFKSSETIIQELEEGLEALFKCLVKTRVSLLNVVSR